MPASARRPAAGPSRPARAADILVLYDPAVIGVPTIEEHLLSFARFSNHRVFYSSATSDLLATDPSSFDAVVCHYSVRVCLRGHLSSACASALRRFRGPKLLFIQDEYETTETARRAIEDLGIGIVFTCVPGDQIGSVYPKGRFSSVRFIQILTGYVPSKLEGMRPASGKGRPYLIGYRGRSLPYWYGDLGQEKKLIGVRMKALCRERGITHDIEWDEEHRIYGEGWYDFLRSCRATLGSESGANVFDEHGAIRSGIEQALREDPSATYEQLRARFIAPHEGKVRMNQVSPRVFEAIACGTALVLFEGGYSGVVRPDEHYIPLRKDFSNVDEVFAKLKDDAFVDAMVKRAYADVIASGRYSYRRLVSCFDEALAPLLPATSGGRPAARTGALSISPTRTVTIRASGSRGWLAAEQPLTAGEWLAVYQAVRGPWRLWLESWPAALRAFCRLWLSRFRAVRRKIAHVLPRK
jgi:Glycosyl transferases group 1